MTEVPTTTTLGSLALQQPLGSTVVIDGQEGVVLAQGDDSEFVEVHQGSVIRQYKPDTAATVLGDPDRQVALLRETLLRVDDLRRRAAEQQERQAAEHDGLLSRIRDYVIARYEDGVVCHEGLNEFLREFGMPEHD